MNIYNSNVILLSEFLLYDHFLIKVNGEWSPWTSFSECSASCAGGIKTRSRQCNSPAPDPDGRPCDANGANETIVCNTEDCPSKFCVLSGKKLNISSYNTLHCQYFMTSLLLQLALNCEKGLQIWLTARRILMAMKSVQ